MPTVLIRTDGNNKIGMGHIYRSIAISQELKKRGFRIKFLFPKNNENLKKLKKYGSCIQINNQKELDLIKKINPQIIIIDILRKFFPIKKEYLDAISKLCKVLVTIDLVDKNVKYANIGIYSLFSPKNYKAQKTFFDPRYSIIRKEFSKLQKTKFEKNVKSILVIQGGSDTHCLIPKILKALNKVEKTFKITTILGSSFDCWRTLNVQIKQMKKETRILHDIENVGVEMKKHQLAISAAGNTLLEILSLGIPSLIVCGERHEIEIANILHDKGCGVNLGYGKSMKIKDLTLAVDDLISNKKLRNELSKTSTRIVDGKGLFRVCNLIENEYKIKKSALAKYKT